MTQRIDRRGYDSRPTNSLGAASNNSSKKVYNSDTESLSRVNAGLLSGSRVQDDDVRTRYCATVQISDPVRCTKQFDRHVLIAESAPVRRTAIGVLGIFSAAACGDAAMAVELGDAETGAASIQEAGAGRLGSHSKTGDARQVFVSELETVLQQRTVRDEREDVVSFEVLGDLPADVRDKVARPWTHLDDPWLYFEEAGARLNSDGTMEQYYAVRRTPNHYAGPTMDHGTGFPSDGMSEGARGLVNSGVERDVAVTVKLAAERPWNVKLLPESSSVSVADFLAAVEERSDDLAEREAEFLSRSSSVVEQIEASGGRVVTRLWTAGYVVAELPVAAIGQIAAREDVALVEIDETPPELFGIPVGNLRDRSRSDVKTFWDNSYYGQDPDTYSPQLVGVTEAGHLADEACFLDENGGCQPSRLEAIHECDSTSCVKKTTSAYNYGTGRSHGTTVAALAVGDYKQNQADGHAVCDSTTTHSSTWEDRSTGMAKEAELAFYDSAGAPNTAYMVKALDCAQGIGTDCTEVDVLNASWGEPDACLATAYKVAEAEMENLFDDGVLPVVAGGNYGTTGSNCNMAEPANVPKTLAVSGIDVSTASYGTAVVDGTFAVRGGGTVQSPNGTNRTGALAMVDLVAPSDGVTYFTQADDLDPAQGCVVTGSTSYAQGTSVAAPLVAGMAAVVKSRYLDIGDTWINSPGRLFTVMLAMADRGISSSAQSVAGIDNLYGFGRAKMRLMKAGEASADPGGYWLTTHTITSAPSSTVFNPFGGTIPTGAAQVKCVMMAHEDMSGKDNVSKIDLKLELTTERPVYGGCHESLGLVQNTRLNSDYDVKKMVAFEDSSVNIEGWCARVTLDAQSLSSAGSVTVNTFCLYSSELDDSPS